MFRFASLAAILLATAMMAPYAATVPSAPNQQKARQRNLAVTKLMQQRVTALKELVALHEARGSEIDEAAQTMLLSEAMSALLDAELQAAEEAAKPQILKAYVRSMRQVEAQVKDRLSTTASMMLHLKAQRLAGEIQLKQLDK